MFGIITLFGFKLNQFYGKGRHIVQSVSFTDRFYLLAGFVIFIYTILIIGLLYMAYLNYVHEQEMRANAAMLLEALKDLHENQEKLLDTLSVIELDFEKIKSLNSNSNYIYYIYYAFGSIVAVGVGFSLGYLYVRYNSTGDTLQTAQVINQASEAIKEQLVAALSAQDSAQKALLIKDLEARLVELSTKIDNLTLILEVVKEKLLSLDLDVAKSMEIIKANTGQVIKLNNNLTQSVGIKINEEQVTHIITEMKRFISNQNFSLHEAIEALAASDVVSNASSTNGS